MRTLLNLTVANVKSLVRDRAALFWTIFFPIMFVFLFGAIFGGSSDTRISVGYVDEDGTPASAGIRQAFAGVTLFKLSDGSLAWTSADLVKMRGHLLTSPLLLNDKILVTPYLGDNLIVGYTTEGGPTSLAWKPSK